MKIFVNMRKKVGLGHSKNYQNVKRFRNREKDS